MCGIAGLMSLEGRPLAAEPAVTALKMADALAHRGPDGRASWGDNEAGIGLGHRRLAIVDLTETGAQPMHSADARFVITFNGEVYNFQELRSELAAHGHKFRGLSDTEVMLAAFVEWGPEKAIERFVGMFAFALFDRKERSLRLVRDRFGVKPLYWAIFDQCLMFGSELRALMAHPGFRTNIDREAIAAMIRYSYVPAPATVFRGVYKLPAGSILTAREGAEPSISRYWSIDKVECHATTSMSAQDANDELERLLRASVKQRMIADVPLGVFLSGGLDSSTVAALMQAQSNTPIRSFTIGFKDAGYDEAPHAREIARHLGTNHTEVVLDSNTALALVPQIADWFDEPFGDSSQLPTYLLAQMTRRHVTVALSGDGGDEVFGGYPKYRWLSNLWRTVGALPVPIRACLGSAISAVPEGLLRKAIHVIDPPRAERIGEKTRRLRAALSGKNADDAAVALASVGVDDHAFVRGATGSLRLEPLPGLECTATDAFTRMQANDMASFLPDDILTKVDRCSMAVSLEAREPLLDHRMVEFVWSLPTTIQRGNGSAKALLRNVLLRYIPETLVNRPKRGFIVPIGDWIRGPLGDWAEDLLSLAAIENVGLFEPARVRAMWERHVSNTQDNATGLWNVLMVQAWAKRWG